MLDLLNPEIIASAQDGATLLASNFGKQGAESFWSTDIGKVIGRLLGAIGVLILLAGLFKAGSHFLNGKAGAGLKLIGGTIVLAALLFNPDILTGFVNLVGTWIGLVDDSVGEVAK